MQPAAHTGLFEVGLQIVMELEQAIDKAVEAVGSVTQASTAPCNKLVCDWKLYVFVSLPISFGKSCRGLRACSAGRKCARTRVSIIAHNHIQVLSLPPSRMRLRVRIYFVMGLGNYTRLS